MPERGLLAVFAHPDDETFRPGGTLALLAAQGVEVHLVTATRGQAGSCGEPPVCTPGELPAVREVELRCACQALGLQPPRVLDFDDGHLAEVDGEVLVCEILSVLMDLEPQVLLTFGPDGLSGHPDHIAAGRAAQEAYARWPGLAACYTVAMPASVASRLGLGQVRPIPDEDVALSVDVGPAWEAKRKAMACHATQSSATPWLRAGPEQQRAFFGREYFARPHVRRPEEDFVTGQLRGHLL
jgi:LmbE family N-acetylglucosaminyl deacetylase